MGSGAGPGLALGDRPRASNGGPPVLRAVELIDEEGAPTNYLPLGGTFRLRVELEVERPIEFPMVGVGIDDGLGQRMITLHTPLSRPDVPRVVGRETVECRVDQFPLAPGDYWVKLAVSALGHELDEAERALPFSVIDGDAFGEGRGHMRGACVAASEWSIVNEHAAAGEAHR